MLVHWIWLVTRPHLTDRGQMALLQQFQDAEDIYYATSSVYERIGELTEQGRQALQDKDLSQAEAIIQTCMEKDFQILTLQDAAYPRRLRNIPDPPPVLYYRGQLPDVDATPTIAVVGTRKASAYGLSTAKRMGYQLSAGGGIVVSGVASGIDGIAMQGALMGGSPVIGVLGCGLDVVYPRSNAPLYEDTIHHGRLLTEFPPGTPPVRWNFPKRNRIMSGLSCGVLVVEAPERSGALITANLAADQGRDVFVVPGNIDVATSEGSNALLRIGAIAIRSGWDILSEYKDQFPDKIQETPKASQIRFPASEETPSPMAKVSQKPLLPRKNPGTKIGKSKLTIDNDRDTPYIDHKEIPSGLSPDEQIIVKLLQDGPKPMDDLITQSGKPAGVVLASMTLLEVKGLVTRLPGKLLKLSSKEA